MHSSNNLVNQHRTANDYAILPWGEGTVFCQAMADAAANLLANPHYKVL